MSAKRLTDRQEAFCFAYVTNNGNGTKSAKDAGYSDISAHSEASRLLKLPHILARIDELSRESYTKQVPALINAQLMLALNARSEKVRSDAIKDLLDRAGHGPVHRREDLTDPSRRPSYTDAQSIMERIEEIRKRIHPSTAIVHDTATDGVDDDAIPTAEVTH